MPIEIRELHIRVAVSPGPAAAGSPPAAGASGAASGAGARDDELVAQCVEQVMELLRGRTER